MSFDIAESESAASSGRRFGKTLSVESQARGVSAERLAKLLAKAAEVAAFRRRVKKGRTRLEELERMEKVMTLTRVQAAERKWLKENLPS